MKKYSLNQFILTALAFALGVFVGQNIDKIKDFMKVNRFLPSHSCQYNGKSYKSGESFVSTDGCNSCGCNDGQVACTIMACEQKDNE